MKMNVLSVQRAIHEDVDGDSYSTHYNMLICMITSLMLFLGAIISFVVRYFILNTELSTALIDSIALAVLGAGFEIFMRTRLKAVTNAIHIISLLYAAVFIFILVRFYHIIGPSIWVLGLVQVLFSMAQSTPVMLRYVLASMSLSILYVVFFAAGQGYELLYGVMLIAFFILSVIVAAIVYKVMNIRNRKIMSQFEKIKIETEERKKAERDNIQLSYFDQATGLPNRTLCIDMLNQALLYAKRSGGKVYAFFLDIDMFKIINDTIGHTMGDELLKAVGERLSETINKNDFVARIGGDEFLVILPELKEEKEAENIAYKILNEMKEPFVIGLHKFSVTCSIGISGSPLNGEDAETLVKCAELAMYKAKEEGKNCFKFFSEDLKHNAQTEMDLIYDMQEALINNEFALYYQPQISSATKTIIGFEALIRWKHPTRGMLMPDEFIPIAEKSGLIVPIGEWVIKSACRQNKAWQEEGLAHVPVAVNISSIQIYNDSIVEQLSSILGETQLDPRFLVLEITERILVRELEKVKEILHRIKEIGVKIAIDDFGTGYSSIYYLKQMPIDLIKIPMEFVHGIGQNIKDESIISVILGLADNLNMEVVAEGVETKKQLDFLRRNLCSGIQGFYFSKPMQASKIKPYCEGHYDRTIKIADYSLVHKDGNKKNDTVYTVSV